MRYGLAKTASDAEALAKAARIEILKMTSRAQASHVGSALSVVDILSSLYAGGANIRNDNADSVDRDIVCFPKDMRPQLSIQYWRYRDSFP